MFSLTDYDYRLPKRCIAQTPARPRDHCRLMVFDRKTGEITHRRFFELGNILLPTDLLVVNDTRVVPARLPGKKETGGKADVLIIDYPGGCDALEKENIFRCNFVKK